MALGERDVSRCGTPYTFYGLGHCADVLGHEVLSPKLRSVIETRLPNPAGVPVNAFVQIEQQGVHITDVIQRTQFIEPPPDDLMVVT